VILSRILHRPSLADDFLRLNPKIAIVELEKLREVGTFIVYATVDGVVDGESWWYPSCRCRHRVTYDSGVYYCKGCAKHIFQIVPRFDLSVLVIFTVFIVGLFIFFLNFFFVRYSVKLVVSDVTGEAIFVVSDADMNFLLDMQCASMVALSKVFLIC
jgi:hypothetical protein